jgi:hypothetical protein
MDGSGYAAQAAVALGPYLEGQDRQRVLSKGLQSALAIGNYEMGAHALITLAPHLDPELRSGALRDALERVLRVYDPRRRTELLELLELIDVMLPGLDGDVLPASLELVRGIDSGSNRAQVLASFAKHLPSSSGLVPEARLLLLDELSALREQPRKHVLELLAHPALFDEPVFPVEQVEQIARAVTEICRGWNWL